MRRTNMTTIDKTQGYVILWRSIMDSAIWTNPKLLKVYQWCLFRANYKPLEEYKGLKKLNINPGQFITSYPHAKGELSMATGTIYNYINLLKAERIIESKSYNKYTVITVLNWNDLQNPERISETKMKANCKQNETDNTYNTLNTDRDSLYEQKKDTKLENHLSYLLSVPSGDLLELSNKYAASQEQVKSKAEDLYNYCKAKGKTYSNYNAFLSNALKRDFGLRASLSAFPERPGFVDAKTLKYH